MSLITSGTRQTEYGYRHIANASTLAAINIMKMKKEIEVWDMISVYVYCVSFLMLGQVFVYVLNERYDWVIRTAFFEILSEQSEKIYVGLLLMQIMFSVANLVIVPILVIILSIERRNFLMTSIALLAVVLYYYFWLEVGPGLI